MTIPTKDQKILWGKAAARCSMPDCKKNLALEASNNVSSQNILIGEMCHIVAESEDGPRGKGVLTSEERNRYPNLILLCANHHTVIDQDPNSWPIEKLHQIKADHEIWVETQLTLVEDDLATTLYSSLVNLATEKLLLAEWDDLSDYAVRLILHNSFVQGTNDFWLRVRKTIWPGKYPELEAVIINLSERAGRYVEHFLSNSRVREGYVHVEDKDWKLTWRTDYDDYAEKSNVWQKKSMELFFNLVVALNEFSEAVRKYLKPEYFYFNGKFVVSDSLGVISNGESCIYVPEKYIDVVGVE